MAKNNDFSLHSMYDGKLNRWFSDKDSFNTIYRAKFIDFMRIKFLKNVVVQKKNINDTILFNYDYEQIEVN